MAFKINGTTVITDARHLNNIVEIDATTGTAIDTQLNPPEPEPTHNLAFAPSATDLESNPSETISGGSTTVSGTWSKPTDMADSESLLVLMTEQGGAGNYYPYQTNWGFAGGGGRTTLIFTSAGDLDGSSYSIPPNATHANWQGQVSTVPVTFTINGTEYSTSTQSTNLVWTNTNSIEATSSNSNSYMSNSAGTVTTVNSMARTHHSTTSQGITTAAVDWAGGHGESNYEQSGSRQISNLSGDGGALSQGGFVPGGGGGGQNAQSYQNIGGYGSIRIWYCSDTVA